jgi:hypothetical protein
MLEGTTDRDKQPPRLRRAMELIYLVEGVTGAQIWCCTDRIAVGLSLTATSNPSEVFERARSAVAPLQEGDETWEFGLLVDR